MKIVETKLLQLLQNYSASILPHFGTDGIVGQGLSLVIVLDKARRVRKITITIPIVFY